MLLSFALLSLPFVSAAITPRDLHHDHVAGGSLPDTWYHEPSHPAYKLFRRAPNSDGATYPDVGSPTWAAAYPTGTPDVNRLPQAWVDALNNAVQAGKIPNIPQSTNTPNTNPTYPQGNDPMSPQICSATYKCRIPGDIWNAPDGYFGTGFDDGPVPSSTKLLSFLQQNNIEATHFMIGINILNNPSIFLNAFNNGNDIAVHTYTHPYMTTLDSKQIVAQLGWTMEIIHNSTGGRLPRFWRPPFGDYDMRVRAIAREVFGLEVIIWNQDTEDWSISSGGTTFAAVGASLNKWLTGPKSPGLIILEHELSDQTVQAFMDAYPVIQQNGWTMKSVAQLNGTSVYQNVDSSGNVSPGIVAIPVSVHQSSGTGSSSTSASSAPSTPSGSGSGAASNASKQNGAATLIPSLTSAVIASWILIFGLVAQ